MLSRGFLAVSVLVYVGIGLWTLFTPVAALSGVGVTVSGEDGVIELRAMYGGLELGIAAFLAWTLAKPRWGRAGVMAATLSLGGLGAVRAVSLLVIQPPWGPLYGLAAAELSGFAFGALCLQMEKE